MKAVLLAGGTGTRLFPLTKVVNKQLLLVGKLPMIVHGIEKLKDAGLVDILIITGVSSAGLLIQLLGSGRAWDVSLTYRIQEEAGGIAHALALAEGYAGSGERFALMLGDNLFENSLKGHVQNFLKQREGARVLLKEVPDPARYGVPEFEGNRIVRIDEKPAYPKSNYCVTGFYLYDGDIFRIIKGIRPSARGELEITDVNNAYAAAGKLEYDIAGGWWTDAGTFRSLHEASARLLGADPS